MGGDKESWLLGISPEGIGVVGMMLNFVVSIPIALLTKPPSEEIQLLVKDIRLPESNS
jgi:cation/acetate symporter